MKTYTRGQLVKINDNIVAVYRDLGDNIEVVNKVTLNKSELLTYPKSAIAPFSDTELKLIRLSLFGHLIKTRTELDSIVNNIP